MNDASQTVGIVMLVAFLGVSWLLSRKLEQAAEAELKAPANSRN